MSTIERENCKFATEEGHLQDFDEYGEEWVAYCMRLNDQLLSKYKIVACLDEWGHMTAEHYKVIDALREYYKKNKIIPMARALSKVAWTPMARIYQLFPAGPDKGAGKIAGLPSRKMEHLRYF